MFFSALILLFAVVTCRGSHECDGATYYGFSSNSNNYQAIAIEDGTVDYKQETPGDTWTGFQGAAIDPTTGKAYMLATQAAGNSQNKVRYLISVNVSEALIDENGTATLSESIFTEIKELGTGWAAITFDCDGTLYGLTTDNSAYQNYSIFKIPIDADSDPEVLHNEPHEVVGEDKGHTLTYNWDDGYLYRFSGHTPHSFISVKRDSGEVVKNYNADIEDDAVGLQPYSLNYLGNNKFLATVDGDTTHYQYTIDISGGTAELKHTAVNFNKLKAVFLTFQDDDGMDMPCMPCSEDIIDAAYSYKIIDIAYFVSIAALFVMFYV